MARFAPDSGCFYREEGDEVLCVTETGALRLDAAAGELWLRLVGGDGDAREFTDAELAILESLIEAGLLVPVCNEALEKCPTRLAHLPLLS